MKEYIKKVFEKENLSEKDAMDAMEKIIKGEASDAQISAFLVSLALKGETPEEIAGFVKILKKYAIKVNPKINETLIDTCGTGADKIKTINVSTIAAIVASASGCYVAKHGNRAVTSKVGSADLLEGLGVRIDLEPRIVERMIEETRFGFIFAPKYHIALKNVAKIRREIGVRTVFNILGPLSNPANVQSQLLGVFDRSFMKKIAEVLRLLNVKKALVVHGAEGIDEISITNKTYVFEVSGNRIEEYEISPEDFGLNRGKLEEIIGGDLEYNKEVTLKILKNEDKSSRRDFVLINAGAAIYVSGIAKDIREGIEIARNTIEEGLAYKKLNEIIEFSTKS